MDKYLIKGLIEIKTGLHIGGDDSFSIIGGLNNPVIKDVITQKPIIPGSSLKGKIRSLLANNEKPNQVIENDSDILKRLFGSTEPVKKARLQFIDCSVFNENKFTYTESKYENTIDRTGGKANPRQIERVVTGTNFVFELIYNREDDKMREDIKKLAEGLKLLESDYLGGGGTRGNGRIAFKNFSIQEMDYNGTKNGDMTEYNKILKEVESYAEKYYKI